MTTPDELAEKARELARRAQELADEAADAQRTEEDLARLDAKLAELREEERRLNETFGEPYDDGNEEEEATVPPPGGGRRADQRGDGLGRLLDHLEGFISSAVMSAVTRSLPGPAVTLEAGATVHGPVEVVVENYAGPVHVEAGDAGRVDATAGVRGRRQEEVQRVTLTATPGPGVVRVVCAPGPGPWRTYADLVVRIPTGSPCAVKTRGGNVHASATAAPVRAETRGGSIKTAATSGPLLLTTMGGSITVEDHDGPVSAETKGGSIRATGRLTGSVRAKTAGGSITLAGVDGTVTSETAGGSITVEGHLTGDNVLTTAAGSVTVTLDPPSALRVDGRATGTDTEFSELRSGRGTLSGTIGSGADGTLTMRTAGGSARLLRGSAG